MSTFVNPFTQFGDDHGNVIQRTELVTSSYLTGIPDTRNIADEQASIIFKQLLKRDPRTKLRALGEFETWLNRIKEGLDIEDAIHISWVQIYAKLCLDNLVEIRQQSHIVLGKMYKLLGKLSTKYLKYTVGPWITSLYDPDPRASQAAQKALDSVFPGTKQELLADKMRKEVVEYIYDSCNNASAQTLSDSRYSSEVEASQKYTRLVKCCLDSMAHDSRLFDLNNPKIAELVYNGRLWKFFSSSDANAALSSLRLASTQLSNLRDNVSQIWKELLRSARKNVGGPSVSLEVLRFMNILTKRYGEIVWQEDAEMFNESMASLAQFINSDPPHSAGFWQLFYNLVLLIPEPYKQHITFLYKPLEKVVLHLKHNKELEESAWGCFVSLAGKMGPKYVQKAFQAAEKRASGVNPPIKSIAKFLSRHADIDGVNETVESQLKNSNKVCLAYLLMLIETHKFKSLIEKYALENLDASQFAILTRANPDLVLPKNLDINADPHWITVAVHSNSVDSQFLIDELVKFGLTAQILAKANSLHHRGVTLQLDNTVLDKFDDIDVVISAVGAHDKFVSRETAIKCLEHLVSLAMTDENQIHNLVRVVKSNREFVDDISAKDVMLRGNLRILANDDRQNVISSLESLSVGKSSSSNTKKASLVSLKLEQLDLSVPLESCKNPLRAPIPVSAHSKENGLKECEKLCVQLVHSLQSREHLEETQMAKLAVLESYINSWMLVASTKDREHMPMLTDALNKIDASKINPQLKSLWCLLESEFESQSKYAVSYHAALAIVRYRPIDSGTVQFSSNYFEPPSLKGALLAYFSTIHDNVQYEQIQHSLIAEALAGKLSDSKYMLIDTKLIPKTATLELSLEKTTDPILATKIIGTFGPKISNLNDIVLQSSDRVVEFSALMVLDSISSVDSILEIASSIPEEGTGIDLESAKICLSLIQKHTKTHGPTGTEFDLQSLLDRNDCLELPWICLQFTEIQTQSMTLHLEQNLQLPSASVSWLIFLRADSKHHRQVSDNGWQQMLTWVATHLRLLDPGDSELKEHCNTDNMTIVSNPKLAARILLMLSRKFPNRLRTWYRDLRDKAFIKRVDRIFSNTITQMLLESLQSTLVRMEDYEEVDISFNVKQREIRARREIEDNFTVEILISIPEQFPCKPAVAQIKNLAGVSEAKKRGWLLEARHNIQEKGIIPALQTILHRVNNYLDGVEPCAICYMTVNDLNKLPNKSCSQCRNIYHSDCLYKWFTSNQNNMLCPMCRSPF